MEEDVFPNRNAKDAPDGLEEERRLFYVAITRAQGLLTLSAARRRVVFGGPAVLAMPSRFLREIPAEALDQPIRWGTELYQANQGGWTPAPQRGGGGSSVAGELARIRGFFDKARAIGGLEPVPDREPEPEPEPAPEPAPSGAWAVGTRVRSPRFGRGVITSATGKGDMLTYTIRFAEAGEKRIIARYGQLERE
jgi:DNA helicase-2/ATP-dependent DNA helicase PcrA